LTAVLGYARVCDVEVLEPLQACIKYGSPFLIPATAARIERLHLHLTQSCRFYPVMTDAGLPIEIWHEIFGDVLRVDFWEPIHVLSYTWRDRKHNYDLQSRHEECWNRQGHLRLVSRRWKALVETYPCTWLRLRLRRLQGMKKGEEVLFVRPIMSSYTYFHPERGLPSSIIGESNTNGITTLTVFLRHSTLIFSLQRAVASLPTIPRLRALHIELPLPLGNERTAASSAVYQLLRAVESSLVSFHLTTETSILRDQSTINLPKLQRFRLKSAGCFLSSISIARWQLPSLQYLDASLLGGRYMHLELAPVFGARLRSLSSLHSLHLRGETFWKRFPMLVSLQLHAGWQYFVVPPIHHPIRELVLSLRRGCSRAGIKMIILAFVRPSDQHAQASNPSLTSRSRKVVLAGLKWSENCRVVEEMMLPDASWEKVAPFVEDELGETLASVRARFM
jgi:hypothetical protein